MPALIQADPPLPDFIDGPLDESIGVFLLLGRREPSTGPFGLHEAPHLAAAVAFPAWVLDTQDIRFMESGSLKHVDPPQIHIIKPTTALLADIERACENLKTEKLNRLRARHNLAPKPIAHSEIVDLIAKLPTVTADALVRLCRECKRLILWRYDESHLHAYVFCMNRSEFNADIRQTANNTATSLIYLDSIPSW